MADSIKRTFDYQGKHVEGEELTFETTGEQWCHYTLSDGSSIKAKLVMIEVVRLEEHDEAGSPIYMFTAQQVVGIQANPLLVKRAN